MTGCSAAGQRSATEGGAAKLPTVTAIGAITTKGRAFAANSQQIAAAGNIALKLKLYLRSSFAASAPQSPDLCSRAA